MRRDFNRSRFRAGDPHKVETSNTRRGVRKNARLSWRGYLQFARVRILGSR